MANRFFFRAALLLVGVTALGACSGNTGSGVVPQIQNARDSAQMAARSAGRVFPGPAMRVCGFQTIGAMRCHAWIRTDVKGMPRASGGPAGYHPVDLQSAYKLPSSTAGAGRTVAIVDAYDDPNAENDLAVYRSQFGLTACTTANGCFKKVNQTGGSTYPKANGGWAQEISLDVDMVSAICPNCHILLVEATSNSNANLYAAEQYAAAHANAVSNSWGGGEYSGEATDDSTYFNHPGVAITVSSGDSGFGAQFPATSRYVTAAGGTTLTAASNGRGWSEAAWSSAGSGCSAYIAAQSWNNNVGGTCSRRSESDVSADADPNTGVSVYDSLRYQGLSGWLVFGGTSVASPILASVYALAGNAGTVNYGQTSYLSTSTSSLFDVTSGGNGSCGTILCNATTGWDGPTGNGTPNGTGAF